MEVAAGITLFECAAKGDLEAVKTLLDNGANIDEPLMANDGAGISPMYIAAINGKCEMVKLLLERGASVVHSIVENGDYQVAPILLATASQDYWDTVKVLIEAGNADVNQTFDQYTPLSLACQSGNFEAVELLLEHGANVKYVLNDKQVTSIVLAAYIGHYEIVKLLLEKAEFTPEEKFMGLVGAAEGPIKDLEVTKLLLTGVPLDLLNKVNSVSPMLAAAERGKIEMVKLFLDYGVNVNLQDDRDTSILYYASLKGRYDVVSLLLERGANIRETDSTFNCALMGASHNGFLDVVDLLLRKGADVHQMDDNQSTAIAAAALAGHCAILQKLLDYGAVVDDFDLGHNSPLLLAAHEGHLDVVELLIAKGADVNADNKDGRTPLFVASQRGHVKCAKVLLEHGADPNTGDPETALHVALKHKRVDLVWLLTLYGANTSVQFDGKTPLDLCDGNPELIKALNHFWTTENHGIHPKCVREAIKSVLLIASKQDWILDTPMIFKIFEYLAFDWFPSTPPVSPLEPTTSRKRKLSDA